MSTIRPEVTGRKDGATASSAKEKKRGPPKERSQTLAMSIKVFCDRHGLSEQFYYELKKQKKGLTPREIELGHRHLITEEEAARWRAERTAASNTTNNT